MANFLTKMKYGVAHVDDGHKSTLAGVAVSKAERYGGAALFGYLKGAYREEFEVKGVPGDLIAGVGLTLGASLLHAFSRGNSKLAPHLSNVGDAGIMSYIGAKFAGIGARQSGRRMYMLQKGAQPPAKLPPGMTAVGALDPVGGGAYLTSSELAQFSNAR